MRKPMQLRRHGNSFHVTICPPMREYLHWEAGDELMGTIVEGKKLVLVDLETFLLEDYHRRRSEDARKAIEAHA